MRLIVSSDLHYDVARSRRPTEALAAEICRTGGDVLMLVGDTASTDLAVFENALGLFDGFRGQRLAVAGNHEFWTPPGGDTLHRYENELAAACSRCGFHYLDASPYLADGVGFVGNVGWYDYSFRSSALNVPLRFYRHKIAPGAAAQSPRHRHLLSEQGDVGEAALTITTRWMDAEHVRLPESDVAFTQRTAARLRVHLNEAAARVDRIVVGVHHIPFAELVPHSILPNWEFVTAFHGSELLGETILECPQVTHAFAGHIHQDRRCQRGHVLCRTIGSTYREKKFEVIEL